MTVKYKALLSNSHRAIAQRERAEQRTEEQKAVAKAGDADRAAVSTLKRKLKLEQKYISASKADQKKLLASALEQLSETRFRTYKSGQLSHYVITYVY